MGGRREFIEERWEVWRIDSIVQGDLAVVNVCVIVEFRNMTALCG